MHTAHSQRSGRIASHDIPALVADIAALNEAVTWRWLLSAQARIQLALPGLQPEKLKRFQSAIERQTQACGCTEGFIAAVLVLAAYLLSTGSRILRPDAGWIALGIALALLGAILGKLFGLLRARMALRRILLDVRAEVSRSSGDRQ